MGQVLSWTIGWIAVVLIGDSAATAGAASAIKSSPLAILRDGARVVITFDGLLQFAPALIGPWTELTTAATPALGETKEKQHFFRVTPPGGTADIFASSTLVNITI